MSDALTLSEVSVDGYRSLRKITFPVGRLGVFVGANGAGKTNLYRALQLIQAAAAGTLSRELASEGGMDSAFWAGARNNRKPARITLSAGFARREDRPEYEYEVAVGIVPRDRVSRNPTGAAFPFGPDLKEERLRYHHSRRDYTLLERCGPAVFALTEDGERIELQTRLMTSETALGSIEEPRQFPDLHMIRRKILDWRFYHELRTDKASALRQPCLAITSPTLASDGRNLAAVFATLAHIREDTVDLDRTIADAFPGAELVIPMPERMASFGMILPEYPERVFEASELSDGTLRFLALAGALLAYRLPDLVALNEPETSLHPDLLEPLARMIVHASERTQIWLVTHSERLAAALEKHGGVRPRTVVKRNGETWIDGLTIGGRFRHEDD
jgi:predicted ATPase